MKYLLYVTKAKPYCMVGLNGNKTYLDKGGKNSVYSPNFNYIGNGKIIAEFEGECEEILYRGYDCIFDTKNITQDELLKKSCLTYFELADYLDKFEIDKACGYAIHIKNLKVFDRPLELNETFVKQKCEKCLYKNCKYYENEVCKLCQLTKAPQNMMWVWYKGEKYCLISIRSEWACKILNGKKTIEVRKKVLKECL